MTTPTNKKILFLDIDGVLNSARSCVALKGYPHDFTPAEMAKFDLVALGLIRRLCQPKDVSIVLSSTWRFYFKPHEAAVGLDLPIIDSTRKVSAAMNDSRGNQIQDWLTEHPEIEKYAIVDDDADMTDAQQPYFVWVDPENGLMWENYLKLCAILEVDPYNKAIPATT